MRHPEARSVLLLDPDNFTPYYVANLGQGLSQRGWSVEWLTSPCQFESVQAPSGVEQRDLFFRSLKGTGEAAGIPAGKRIWWLRRAGKALSYPFDLMRLDRELTGRPPGILHVQWALLPQLDRRFWSRWQRRSWKIVYTAHDLERRAGTSPWWAGSTRSLVETADAVVVHSRVDQATLRKRQIPAERIWRIVPGGPGIFWQSGPAAADAKRELGLEVDRPIILFFGLIKAYKGVEVLLRSLNLVQQQVPKALLLVAGQIPGREGHWRRRFKHAESRGNTVWHPGYVPQKKVGTYFAAADVVALPYLTSSSSAVVPQAYAAGRPVVASQVGALMEMIPDGESGLLVPPGDEQALARTLIELLTDRAEANRMGAGARQLAANYCWDRASTETDRLYRSLKIS